MRIFGFEIVRYRAIQREKTGISGRDRLNLLETRVERLEADTAERQLTVLSTVEKVLHQLRARERKRQRDAEPEEVEVDPEVDMGNHQAPPAPSAVLSRRFRRW